MDRDIGDWIKLHRKILDNPIVLKDADHLAIWVYILLKATYIDYDVLYGKDRITLKAGQVILGRNQLSKFLKISESKIQRVLNVFKSERMIEQIATPRKGRIITVLQWGQYQSSERISGRIVNELWTNSERIVNGKQEYKNNKNIKNIRIGTVTSEKIIKLWNENFNQKISITDLPLLSSLSFSEDVILDTLIKATKSEFLKGSKGFNMNFKFFTNPKNFKKIQNGKYNDMKVREVNNLTIKLSDKDNRREEYKEYINKNLQEKIPTRRVKK